ncbi:MAG TPA: TlpA family protein disulfide reductase [Chitinophagales bacterium]
MKKIAFIFAVFISANGYAQNEFHLTAKIIEVDTGIVYLNYTGINDSSVIDSLPYATELHFKGNVSKDASRAYLRYGAKNRMHEFYLDKGNAEVSEFKKDSDYYFVDKGEKGSATNVFVEYKEAKKQSDLILDSLEEAYDKEKKAGNNKILDAIDKQYDSITALEIPISKNFIRTHSESGVSASILNDLIRQDLPADTLKNLFASLSQEVQNSKRGKDVSELIEKYAKTAVGQSAPLFTQKDVNGKDVAFTSINKGKVLLLDFWASWCGPCRRENPNVVAAYEKYHAKGFEILGISLDKDEAKWKAAIEKDKLTWQHLSDLKGWDNEVAKLYAIRAIPSNLLIDANGIIIAKNLRGEALEQKLEELLK